MTGIPEFIEALRTAGFGLVFLWLLTLSIVYGILSTVAGGIPKSATARGIISISAAFLVLLAASGPATATFLSNLVSSLITIAFGLLITMVFLEIAGVKVEGTHIFQKYGLWAGLIVIVLVVLVFIGAGGLNIIGLPQINIGSDLMAVILFIVVVIGAIWVLYTEKEAKGK